MSDDLPSAAPLPPDDLEGEELVLTELVSRVLDRGVVLTGEVTISVAGIDLVELGLRLRLVSTETARRQQARDEDGESSPTGGEGG